jgi:glutathione synthase/RimK-type ligase-like ATP-grasp enzyme
MKKIVVASSAGLPFSLPDVPVVTGRDYLTSPEWVGHGVHVVNLSPEYRYGSRGYYVSLLAEARGHRVLPGVKTIQDLKTSTLTQVISDELSTLIGRSLRRLKTDEFVLSVYFGKNMAKQHDRLAREIFRLFQAPLLRARFSRGKTGVWEIRSVRALSMSEVPPEHMEFLGEAARAYFSRRSYRRVAPGPFRYDLAILHNPEEPTPPSDPKALGKFVDAGERAGFNVELVTRDDYARMGEFDALLIRETTGVNHHTYRFARKAESQRLAVIDDPDSILRCTNKVYLAELLGQRGVPTPKTVVVHRDNADSVVADLGLPLVLKVPDGSFSTGVMRAASPGEVQEALNAMLERSDLVIAQAFTPTDYDWRVGVLDGEALFACKYYMARGHWQIYNWSSRSRRDREGAWETVAIEAVPAAVLETAIRATGLIGTSLYGVDLKEVDGRAMVIEVNDNPNIDAGVEDAVEGDALYDRVIAALRTRIGEVRKP